MYRGRDIDLLAVVVNSLPFPSDQVASIIVSVKCNSGLPPLVAYSSTFRFLENNFFLKN